jgi:hypothetical protein
LLWALSWLSVGAVGLSPILAAWMVQLIAEAVRRRRPRSRRTHRNLAHDDEIDACRGALEMLNPQMKGWGIYEFYRQKAEQLRAERKAQDEATGARVRLRAPPGIGSVQTFWGRRFRLERLPGGACTHWKAPPCHGVHPKPTFVSLPADRWVYWGAVIRNRPAPAHRYAGGGHHARPCRTSALGQGAAARPSYRGLFHLRISGQ